MARRPLVRIILVRPRNPLNIGAVARVMANFGFHDLMLVSPYPPVWEEARRAGPGAGAVLARARRVETLAEAIADCGRVIGTTCGARRKLDREFLSPAELRRVVRPERLALVFGPEKTGLSNEELSFCHRVLRIPTVPAAPSLNLAQAVAICCYELSREPVREVGGARRAAPTASAGDILRLLDLAASLLEAAGFLDAHTGAARLRKLRQILLRANLCSADVALLTAAVRQLQYNFSDASSAPSAVKK